MARVMGDQGLGIFRLPLGAFHVCLGRFFKKTRILGENDFPLGMVLHLMELIPPHRFPPSLTL